MQFAENVIRKAAYNECVIAEYRLQYLKLLSQRERERDQFKLLHEIPTSEELENEVHSLFTIHSIKGSVRPLLVTMTLNDIMIRRS